MAEKISVRILKHERNGHGHRTFHCQVEEVDAQGVVHKGPVVLCGIDRETLQREHAGNYLDFLSTKHRQALIDHHHALKREDHEAEKLVGKLL